MGRILLLLVAVLCSTACAQQSSVCGLSCFLKGLSISLQDIPFPGGTLTNVQCANISVGAIISSVSQEVFSVSTQNLEFSCSLDWDAPVIGKGTASFLVDAYLFTSVAFEGTIFPSRLVAREVTPVFRLLEFELKANNPVENFLLQQVLGRIKNATQIAIDLGAKFVVAALIDDVSTNLQTLNTVLSAPLAKVLDPLFPPNWNIVDLQNSTFLSFIDYMANTVIGTQGLLNVNFLIDRFTNGTGVLSLCPEEQGPCNFTLQLDRSIGGIGTIDFSSVGGQVTGLDSWNVLQLLLPTSSHVLSSELNLGSLALQNFGFDVAFHFDNSTLIVQDSATLTERFSLATQVSNLSVAFDNVLALDGNVLYGLQGLQFADAGCLKPTVVNASISSLAVSAMLNQFTLASPPGTDSLDLDLRSLINGVFSVLDKNFPEFFPAVLVHTVSGVLQSKLYVAPASQSANETAPCMLYNDATDGFYANFPLPFIPFVACMAGFGFLALLTVVVTFFIVRSQKIKDFHAASEEDDALIWRSARPSSAASLATEPSWSSMLFAHPRVNPAYRISIPWLMFFGIALYITVMCATTGFTALIVTSGTSQVSPPSLFLFDLPSLIQDAYDAQAWANVIGLAVFGIFWVFLRQGLLVLVFFLPTKVLSLRARHHWTQILDTLGKWNAFFQIEAMLIPVAFRLNAAPVPGVAFDVYTAGSMGYFAFVLSVYVCTVAGILVLASHRATIRRPDVDDGGEIEPMFLREFRVHGEYVKLRPGFVVFLVIGGLIALGLVVASIFTDSFSYTLMGLARLTIPYVGTPVERRYNIFFMIMNYGEISVHNAGLQVSQVGLFIPAVLCPIVANILTLIVLLVPMRRKVLKGFIITLEVFRSFNFLEVFMGSILASALSVSLLGVFLVGDKCNLVNQILAQFFSADLNGETTCYNVRAGVLLGFWLMIAASVVQFVISQAIVSIGHAAVPEYFMLDDADAPYDRLNPKSSKRKSCDWRRLVFVQAERLKFTPDIQ